MREQDKQQNWVLADSGFFIGLFRKKDNHHAVCLRFLQTFTGKLVTTWANITEVCYFLNKHHLKLFFIWAQEAQENGQLLIENPSVEGIGELWSWMNRYSDLPMDFADASLVLVAINHNLDKIATTDTRDFTVYTLPRRKKFKHVLYA